MYYSYPATGASSLGFFERNVLQLRWELQAICLDDLIIDSTLSSVLSSWACVALLPCSVGFMRDCNSFTFSTFTLGFITVRMFPFSVLKLGLLFDGYILECSFKILNHYCVILNPLNVKGFIIGINKMEIRF